jgi:hypothetical protein
MDTDAQAAGTGKITPEAANTSSSICVYLRASVVPFCPRAQAQARSAALLPNIQKTAGVTTRSRRVLLTRPPVMTTATG